MHGGASMGFVVHGMHAFKCLVAETFGLFSQLQIRWVMELHAVSLWFFGTLLLVAYSDRVGPIMPNAKL